MSQGEPVPVDIAALFIAYRSTGAIFRQRKFRVDQYSCGEESCLPPESPECKPPGTAGRPDVYPELALDDMLQQYGLRVLDLIRDAVCEHFHPMQQRGFIRFQSQIPFHIPSRRTSMGGTMITLKTCRVMFYFVSSVDTTAAVAQGLKQKL